MELREAMTTAAFYSEVFGDSGLVAGSEVIRVRDLEDTLARVWDCGGTVVFVAHTNHEAPGRATFRDPSGRLVALERG